MRFPGTARDGERWVSGSKTTKSSSTRCFPINYSHILDQPSVQGDPETPGLSRPIRLQLPGGADAEGPQEEAQRRTGPGDHWIRHL